MLFNDCETRERIGTEKMRLRHDLGRLDSGGTDEHRGRMDGWRGVGTDLGRASQMNPGGEW